MSHYPEMPHISPVKDLVSVIIPTFNRCQQVQRSVDSVLQQDYATIEVIVVDDGSTDDTVARLRRRYGQLVTIVAQPHAGLPNVARNLGIRLSKGEYISFLDSDDYFLPDKISKQVALLQAAPQLGTVFCDMVVVDSCGRRIGKNKLANRHPVPQGYIFQNLLRQFDRSLTTFQLSLEWLLIRRSVLEDTGLLCEFLPFMEDWEYTLRLAARAQAGFVNEALVVSERNGNNYSSAFVRDYRMDPARYLVPIIHLLE